MALEPVLCGSISGIDGTPLLCVPHYERVERRLSLHTGASDALDKVFLADEKHDDNG